MAGWQPAGFGSTIDERTLVDEAFLSIDGELDGTELDERAGRDDLAAYRRGRRRARTRRLATGAAGLVGLGVAWQIAASILRDPVFLPSVTQTVATFLHYVDRPYPAQGPPLAYIPLFIIWFGIGELPKEILIIIGVAPIMAVTSVAALDEVPEDLRLCARTLGASRLHTLVHVQLRSALPGILTGMRISMAAAWTSIVAAELIAATSGLGYLIQQAGD